MVTGISRPPKHRNPQNAAGREASPPAASFLRDLLSSPSSPLKLLRLAAGVRVVPLARALGLHYTTLHRIEAGTYPPSPELVRRLAEILQVDPDALCPPQEEEERELSHGR